VDKTRWLAVNPERISRASVLMHGEMGERQGCSLIEFANNIARYVTVGLRMSQTSHMVTAMKPAPNAR
jgi:hypothetical protein